MIAEISNANGVSGFEDDVVAAIVPYAEKVGETKVDRMRNVFIRRKGNTGSRPVVQLDAHSDEVGFMVQAICPNGTLRIIPIGGWVSHNIPAHKVWVRNRYGKGTVYTLGFPMERLAYDAPGHYDGEAWKIYETVLRKELLVKTDSRYVLESEHAFSENRVAVLLVNSGLESYTGKPAVASGWKIVSAKTDDPAAVQFENGTLKMEMNSGILLILERMK